MGDTGSRTPMSRPMSRNETFLRAVFGDQDWEHAHISGVTGDPSKGGLGWFGGRAGVQIKKIGDNTNNYFCVGLFTGPRRRKIDFLKLVCLVIDDVGPKIDPAAVELLLGAPTWIIETSPGNFQWGYRLETQIRDPAAGDSLIRRVRIILTGQDGKDPGQQDVNRYMRLPTGLNTKKTLGNPWKVRLVKLDGGVRLAHSVVAMLVPGIIPLSPDNEFGLDPISAPIIPAPITITPAPITSERIGVHAADTLLAAMRKLGLVLGGPRDTAMGWGFDIRCPWVDEHTERAETGTVYIAGAGKFKCQHGHCADRTVEDVRAKLDEMLRDAGHLGGLIGDEFEVIDPATVPPPPQGLQTRVRTKTEVEFFERFVVLGGRNMFFDLHKNHEITTLELDDRWSDRLVPVLPRYWAGKKQKLLLPSKWLRRDGREVSGRIGWPGMPRVIAADIDEPERLFVNMWEPRKRPLKDIAETEVDEKAIEIWLQVYWHVVGWDTAEEWIVGDKVLDWLSLLVGDLSEKPGWQVLITGPQGLGKDSVMLPFAVVLGPYLAQTVQSQQFGTDFNEWAGGRLVQVNETRQNTRGAMTGHDVMNVLKSVFDNSRKWLVVNPKYGRKYECRNVVMGWFTSNDRDPLRLEPGDRRFLVIDRDGAPLLSQDKYAKLHAWLTDQTSGPGGLSITGNMRVAEFFYRRWERMSADRRKALFGTAPMTAAKQDMLSRLVDPIEDWIRHSVVRDLNDPLRFPDIVHARYVHARLETAIKLGGEGLPGRVWLPSLNRIGHHLRAAGAEMLNGGRQVRVGGVPVVLWAVRDFAMLNKLSPVDLAKLYVQATGGKTSLN